MTRFLIINADDYGRTQGVSHKNRSDYPVTTEESAQGDSQAQLGEPIDPLFHGRSLVAPRWRFPTDPLFPGKTTLAEDT